MFTKILCPVDFSPGSQQALRVAARLARDGDADLVLAHIWYVPPMAYAGESPLPADTLAVLAQDEQRALADAARQATALGVRKVSTLFLTGVPWDTIVEAAQDPSFDLVVVGTHGRTGLTRFLLGSVAERVVRHAPCSVLVARGDTDAFHHVLCPVDFSESSRDAIGRASEVAAESVTLLHALEQPPWYRGESRMVGFLEELDRRSARLLHDWAGELGGKTRLAIAQHTRIGNPAAIVLGALDEDPRLDLVVVGSHGRTGIRRALLGSVAEKVVRHARCSVLVARPRRMA